MHRRTSCFFPILRAKRVLCFCRIARHSLSLPSFALPFAPTVVGVCVHSLHCTTMRSAHIHKGIDRTVSSIELELPTHSIHANV